MKNLILCALVMSLALACTPDGQFSPEVPGQDSGENGVENYTPEISVDENGYDGDLAADKDVVAPGMTHIGRM